MIPAYAHSLSTATPGTHNRERAQHLPHAQQDDEWTGNPKATTAWTTSGTCMAYASAPDPMKNTTSPVHTQ
jgi:hypothetical protein